MWNTARNRGNRREAAARRKRTRQKCSLPDQEVPHHLWSGRGDFPEAVEPAIRDGSPAAERGEKGDSSRRLPVPDPKTEIPVPPMRPQRSSPDNFDCALSQRPSRYPYRAVFGLFPRVSLSNWTYNQPSTIKGVP
jgi:hypothetical protein